MQVKISEIKEQLKEIEFTADSGNGLVKNPLTEIMECGPKFEEAYKEEKDMLNDLIIASITKFYKEATTEKENRMNKVTQGFNIKMDYFNANY